jgi:hypothetical protein
VAGAKSAARAASSALFSVLRENKELLQAYGLAFRKDLEMQAKGAWLARQARASIAEGQAPQAIRPVHWDGPVPGARLPGLGSPGARSEREEAARAVRALLEEKLGPMGHNIPVGR